jgi:hypothetical protein
MILDQQQILSLSRDLWASVLGLQVGPAPERRGSPHKEPVWSSRINVSGPWRGAIVIDYPESVARHAAAMLCSADAESASSEEIADALSDLAKIVGEKMRSLLPASSELSRPSVVEPSVSASKPAGMRDMGALTLSCEGRPLRIAFLEADSSDSSAT